MKWGVFSTGGVICCGLAGRVPGWNRLWFLGNRNSRNRFSPLLLFQKHRVQLMSKYVPVIAQPIPWLAWMGTEAQSLISWDGDREELRLLPQGKALWSFSCCSVEMNSSENIPWNIPKLHGVLIVILPNYMFICGKVTSLGNRIFPAVNMVYLFHLFNLIKICFFLKTLHILC